MGEAGASAQVIKQLTSYAQATEDVGGSKPQQEAFTREDRFFISE